MEGKVCASVFVVLLSIFIATQNGGVSASNSTSGCLPVSAAIRSGHALFFFYGYRYTAFNSITRQQLHTGWVRNFFRHLPYRFRIDAAFTPIKAPGTTILISKDKYIAYSSNGQKRSELRPLSNIFRKDKNFAQGIDAAVTYNGEAYFFKGCRLVVKKGPHTVVGVYSLTKLRLPCNISAAWVNRGRIVISKNAYAWLMKGRKVLNARPLCFANSFKTDANICKCRKKIIT